ncbi:MAG: quinone-dependent dihydroorotate dehydrogenase, partial [Bdellovibrionales bacterium]|nr:quinone-dependent dihydroorotate dehydrogenase [Bdellovibrionales bacterium]
EVVKILQESLDGVVPIIGCGGISNGADVRKYREAGACAVQIYTSFIYRGPAVIAECIRAWGE